MSEWKVQGRGERGEAGGHMWGQFQQGPYSLWSLFEDT